MALLINPNNIDPAVQAILKGNPTQSFRKGQTGGRILVGQCLAQPHGMAVASNPNFKLQAGGAIPSFHGDGLPVFVGSVGNGMPVFVGNGIKTSRMKKGKAFKRGFKFRPNKLGDVRHGGAINFGRMASNFRKGITSAFRAVAPHLRQAGFYVREGVKASAPHVKNAVVSGVKAIEPELREAGQSMLHQAVSGALAGESAKQIAKSTARAGTKSIKRKDVAEKLLKGSVGGVSQDVANVLTRVRAEQAERQQLEGVAGLFEGEGIRRRRPTKPRQKRKVRN